MKPQTNQPLEIDPPKKGLLPILLQVLLIIIVLGCGIALAGYYLKTGPQAKPRKRVPPPTLVQVKPISFQDHQLTLEGMGTIYAAKEVNLTPGVNGEIVNINKEMVPGGSLVRGDILFNIDPIDYKLAALELQNEVDIASHELALEMGSQRIAQKEFEILGQTVSASERTLILREPQLKIKHATLKNKQAKLAKAELNLSRTAVTAPFNSVIISTSVNLGSRVSQSTSVAKLAGTDEFWMKILLPVEQLKWITLPADDDQTEGSSVRIYLDNDNGSSFRTGKISKLAPNLEDQGKLAIVYATVQDPLSFKPENQSKPKLLLGSFVRAEITGITFRNVLTIERNHLRENNSVWIMDENDRLDIRPVDIIAKNRDQILVSNSINAGEKLITSALSAPVQGAKLTLFSQKKARPKQEDNKGNIPQQNQGSRN